MLTHVGSGGVSIRELVGAIPGCRSAFAQGVSEGIRGLKAHPQSGPLSAHKREVPEMGRRGFLQVAFSLAFAPSLHLLCRVSGKWSNLDTLPLTS